MAVPLALAATGAVNYLGEFQTLAKSGMMFNGDIGAQVMSNMWEMCKSAPTKSNTPFSHVFIHDKIAKEFDGDNLSDWVQKLDNHMVTACTMAVRDLKLWLKEHGADYLTWDKVESIFNNCDYIVKDDASAKRINDIKIYDEVNWFRFDGSPDECRKREIITWFKDLFNKEGEQAVLDNSVIVQEGTLDRLASIAAETGAAVKDPASLFVATDKRSDKVMEIGVIRFPRREDPYIKLFRLEIFAFFKSSRILVGQRDQAGFEIEYNSVQFKPNKRVVDGIAEEFVEKAREKLKDPKTFEGW